MARSPQKAIRGLAFENDSGGEHAMSDGVAGGGELASLSDRAAGFGAVGAGCVLLTFGAHATKGAHGSGEFWQIERHLLILRGI
jgi:hypothetical protein